VITNPDPTEAPPVEDTADTTTTAAAQPLRTITVSGEAEAEEIEEASALDSIKAAIRQWWADASETDQCALWDWFGKNLRAPRPPRPSDLGATTCPPPTPGP
jgi:hypothetical protein